MRYQQHYIKVERNVDFYDKQVKERGYKDWSIITLFHIALHYIDEYLSRMKGEHEMRPTNNIPPHSVRNNHVLHYLGPEFHTKFFELFELSKEARYRDGIETQMPSQDIDEWENWVMTDCRALIRRMT